MMKNKKSWLLNDEEYKETLKEKEKEYNEEVLQSRIVSLLNKDKTQRFTNKEIAEELGVSVPAVSRVTSKLYPIGCINIVGYRKSQKGSAQIFQSSLAKDVKIEIVKDYISAEEAVMTLLKNTVSVSWTASKISKKLAIKVDRIRESLRILLIQGMIKIVSLEPNKEVEYQIKSGKLPEIEVLLKAPENYALLSSFVETHDQIVDTKYYKDLIKSNLEGVLCISKRGISTYYKMEDLLKAIEISNEDVVISTSVKIRDFLKRNDNSSFDLKQIMSALKINNSGVVQEALDVLVSNASNELEILKEGYKYKKQKFSLKNVFKR